jgi:Tol biopolymer transport system component
VLAAFSSVIRSRALRRAARSHGRAGEHVASRGRGSTDREAPLGASVLRLSPDGKRVAYSEGSGVTGNEDDLWIYDLDRNIRTRLTTDPGVDHMPVWSPDGSRLVFDSSRGQSANDGHALFEIPANGATPERLLFEPELGTTTGARDWSRDGRLIVFGVGPRSSRTVGRPPNGDLWVLPLSGDRKPFPYLATPHDESEASPSPHGRWLAYTSNESIERLTMEGRALVYAIQADLKDVEDLTMSGVPSGS